MKINKNLLLALALSASAISMDYIFAQEVQEFAEKTVTSVPESAIPRLMEPATEEAGEVAAPTPATSATDFMTADLSIATQPIATQQPAKPAAPAAPAPIASLAQQIPAATVPATAQDTTQPAVPEPAILEAAPVTQPAQKPLIVVEPAPTGKNSQTLEESLGLQQAAQPETQAAQDIKQTAAATEKPLQLPEIAQLPESNVPTQPAVQAEPVKPATITQQPAPTVDPAVVKAAEKPMGIKSDEETCTKLCQKVCVGLKEEERKALELEDTQRA